jgi:hypothetical protein
VAVPTVAATARAAVPFSTSRRLCGDVMAGSFLKGCV